MSEASIVSCLSKKVLADLLLFSQLISGLRNWASARIRPAGGHASRLVIGSTHHLGDLFYAKRHLIRIVQHLTYDWLHSAATRLAPFLRSER